MPQYLGLKYTVICFKIVLQKQDLKLIWQIVKIIINPGYGYMRVHTLLLFACLKVFKIKSPLYIVQDNTLLVIQMSNACTKSN